jgi:RNA polymerase sigma factor (sigma-70 family)
MRGVSKLELVSPRTTPARAEVARVDPAEWDAIIRAHDRRVWLSVLALGVRADRARDVVQTAWTRLMEKDGRGEITKDNIAALAIAQARFLALDELRRTQNDQRRTEPLNDVLDEIDPESQMLGRQRLQRAAAMLATSSPATQRLVQLLYSEPSVGYAAAAAELGLSLQRVRQIMCELRKRLRAALEEVP